MVPGKGVEPLTSGSTIQRSDQLSYPGTCLKTVDSIPILRVKTQIWATTWKKWRHASILWL